MISKTISPALSLVLLTAILGCYSPVSIAEEPIVINLWPASPPGETKTLPPEKDTTTADSPLVAGRRVARIGNVSTPQIAVYQPAPEIADGSAVLICPGGGHYILAYDLEGTEVAKWLNSIGTTAIVLKYRVPSRQENGSDQRWLAAVQDAQRAMSLVRHNAAKWKLAPDRIGICGFSAGGETAALTSVFLKDRKYSPVDDVDSVSCRPDFAMLVYTGGLVDKNSKQLKPHVIVTPDVPPMFLVHAYDDNAPAENSLAFTMALKQAGVSAELHLYAAGGHGYGMRPTEKPVTKWPQHAEAWLREMKMIQSPSAPSDEN